MALRFHWANELRGTLAAWFADRHSRFEDLPVDSGLFAIIGEAADASAPQSALMQSSLATQRDPLDPVQHVWELKASLDPTQHGWADEADPVQHVWSGLGALAVDEKLPFVSSLLNARSGDSYLVLYQEPAAGSTLMPGGSMVINADTRQLMTGGAADGSDFADGDHDQMIVGGQLPAGFALGGAAAGHEELIFLPGSNYSIKASDADVGRGDTLNVVGTMVGSANNIVFDGSAETDGRYRFMGSDGADSFIGGSGDDVIAGLGGGDRLNGGGGSDRFVYLNASESSGHGYDTLVGFDFAHDTIDLPTAIVAIDAARKGAASQGTLDADLTSLFAADHLAAGHAAWFTPDQGDLAGKTFLIADGNGVAGYQAGEDYVFLIDGPPPADLGGHGFIV